MTKSSISVELDVEAKRILEKRAKAEFLTLSEMVADIIRRSVLSYRGKTSPGSEKLDDAFIGYFSRKNKKRK